MMRGMFRRKLKDFAEQLRENQKEMSLVERIKGVKGSQTLEHYNFAPKDKQSSYNIDQDNEQLDFEVGSQDGKGNHIHEL